MIAHGQILNAGVMIQPFKMIGGIESTMATNHFGESQSKRCVFTTVRRQKVCLGAEGCRVRPFAAKGRQQSAHPFSR